MTSLTHNGRGRERHLSYFVKPPIQPASCRNSSLSATLAGRVNFAALLLCLVFVIVSHSHAPSAAFRLVLGSCVMRVPTRQSITSAKDLCIVRSVDCRAVRYSKTAALLTRRERCGAWPGLAGHSHRRHSPATRASCCHRGRRSSFDDLCRHPDSGAQGKLYMGPFNSIF